MSFSDKFKDECGVFGIVGHGEAAHLTYLGLHALQHRGQESAGIVSSDGQRLHLYKEQGLVADVFDQTRLAKLPGRMAMGHVRYSTTGASALKNAQPIIVETLRGTLAVAHNGNLVNAEALRKELEGEGALFQSSSDTEVILHLVARNRKRRLEDRIIEALKRVRGAYSLLFLTEDKLVVARDPYGFRPLVLGRLGNARVAASETCAFSLIDADYEREVKPGELVSISARGARFERRAVIAKARETAHCVFEYVYFAKPDSAVFGRSVYEVRRSLGRVLAEKHPVEADIVVPVPDSGVPAAIGYAEASHIPLQFGLIRSHYVGRTFIEPTQAIRHFGVKLKLSPVREVLEGKRVVVIDDSIVRGTTSRKIVKMIRQAGAKEVHLRVSSPPIVSPCYYGIDTPTRKELIGSSHTAKEIQKYLRCDSLAYLALDELFAFSEKGGKGFCDACFTKRYPVALRD